MTSAEPLATHVQYTTMFSRGNPTFSVAVRCVLKQALTADAMKASRAFSLGQSFADR
jgi:hypothetical protein